MGLDSKKLNLDLRFGFAPKAISDLPRGVSLTDDISKKLSKLNDYICALEQELKKIDAFRRELPLCMLLLNDAIEKLKEEVVECKERKVETLAMEEFIPLKGNSNGDGGPKGTGDSTDKRNWMSSAQLWSTSVQYENNFDCFKTQDSFSPHKSGNNEENNEIDRRNQFESWNFKNRGEPFVPFKKRYGGTMKAEEDFPVDGLSLSMPLAESNYGRSSYGTSHGSVQEQQQQPKKQRRCWSPDLHKRFLNALQQLGGAQVATPKQIRELMQVDGLTNDEVKSHLQKYRLHVQKLPAPPDAPPNFEWLRREECNGSRRSKIGQSGSPEGPLHLGGQAKVTSVTAGESLDNEEDEKSESHSWKGQSQRPIEEHV